ncbi:MAG TPA: class I SAM-dependent methyltransferase [Longimicrobium sp.]|jgi:SAM-dependent methyltransferase
MVGKKGSNLLRERLGRESRRIVAQGMKVLLRLRIGEEWRPADDGSRRRAYPDYETYLEHQRTKLDAFRGSSIERHDRRFHAALAKRLAVLPISFERKAVLCLAARQGSEVRAFIDQGAFAVGIDLNPGRDNRYVVVGDFHDLQFAAGTVDVVYTNSLDHAFDLGRILAEVRRVLVPGGILIAEVGSGGGEGRGFYEALSWDSVDTLMVRFVHHGFRVEHRHPITIPWKGELLLLHAAP